MKKSFWINNICIILAAIIISAAISYNSCQPTEELITKEVSFGSITGKVTDGGATTLTAGLHDKIAYMTWAEDLKGDRVKLYLTDGNINTVIDPVGANSNYKQWVNKRKLDLDMVTDSSGNSYIVYIDDKNINLIEEKTKKETIIYTEGNNERVGDAKVFLDTNNNPLVVYRVESFQGPTTEVKISVCSFIRSQWICKLIEKNPLSMSGYILLDAAVNPLTKNIGIIYVHQPPQTSNANHILKYFELDTKSLLPKNKLEIPIYERSVPELAFGYTPDGIPRMAYSFSDGTNKNYRGLKWPYTTSSIASLENATNISVAGLEITSVGNTPLIIYEFWNYTFPTFKGGIYVNDPNSAINPRISLFPGRMKLFGAGKLVQSGKIISFNNNINGILGYWFPGNVGYVLFAISPDVNGNCGELTFQNSFKCTPYQLPAEEAPMTYTVTK